MEIIHKVKNGKMLRIDITIEDNTIKQVKIMGDFFMHPEEAVVKMEDCLKNRKISQIRESLREFIKSNDVQIIGFSIDDLADAIEPTT